MIDHRLRAAVRENAEWVDLVCRSHGSPAAFTSDRWFSGQGTPPFYPDAETLRPGVSGDAVLDSVDTGPGCSVKDSFADLDLTPRGFRVLFGATWIWRPAAGPAGYALDPVIWPVIRSEIVDDPAVTTLGGGGGSVVAHVSGAVVGMSNLVGAWAPAVAAIAAMFPDRPIVGYVQQPRDAVRLGFEPLGPLRVWHRP